MPTAHATIENIELPENNSRTLEALAAEGYRSRLLSESQVRRMLGFESRIQVHEFLKKMGVYLDYSESDLEHDLETHKRLGILPDA